MTIHLYMLSGGFPILLLALCSYYFFDQGWKKTGIVRLGMIVFSAFLFLIGLFVYQSNVLFVFVCTALHVLKDFLLGKNVSWQRIGRDCLFYAFLMGVYYFLHTHVLLKMMPVNPHHYSPIGSRYEFTASFNFLSKIGLLADIFVVSLSGIFHTVFFNYGAILCFLVLTLGHITLACLIKKEDEPRGGYLKRLFFFLVAMFILFIFMNAPCLMAKNCYNVYGYRVLFAPAVIFLLWQTLLWIKIYELFQSIRIKIFLKIIGILFILASFFIPLHTLALACDGFYQELSYVRHQVETTKWSQINSILVIPQEEGSINFTGHHLAYEYSLPTRYTNLIQYFAKKQGVIFPRAYEVHNSVFYKDPRTAIMDIKSAWPLNTKSSFTDILVSTSNGDPGDLIITREGNKFFTFSQLVGKNEFPFWHVDFNDLKPRWFEINFQNHPQVLKNFSFGVISIENLSLEKVVCLVAASNGDYWEKLEQIQYSEEQGTVLFHLENQKSFRQYRFIMIPVGDSKIFNIGAILMELDW